MPVSFQQFMSSLAQYGQHNDANSNERAKQMLNITHDTGEFLLVLVKVTAARRVLEIGTSNGYSTLWLAQAVQAINGTVTTIEASEYKVALATKNFTQSGLAPYITLRHDDAGQLLAQVENESFDLIFLDSERSFYVNWWPDLKRVLCSGGLLVVDNAVSHADQMAAFIEVVDNDPAFSISLVPVGKGEFLAVKDTG